MIVGAFNLKNAPVVPFSVIVKTLQRFDFISTSTVSGSSWCVLLNENPHLHLTLNWSLDQTRETKMLSRLEVLKIQFTKNIAICHCCN